MAAADRGAPIPSRWWPPCGPAPRRSRSTARRSPITDDEVVVSESPRSGWSVASSGPDTVALDLELTHELRLLGLARDVVRSIQDARKSAGFDVTDRIELRWRVGGSPEPGAAVRQHADTIAAEVLATTMDEGAPVSTDGFAEATDEDLGLHIWLRRTE